MTVRWDDLPDSGLLAGILMRLGLRRTVRVWGFRFQARHPYLPPQARWSLRKGRWERPEAGLALAHVMRDRPVVELGGGLGVVACMINSVLEDPSDHVVVEMDGKAIDIIHRNARLNGADFDVLHGMVSYRGEGTGVLGRQRTYRAGQRLGPAGEATDVTPVRLEDLANRFDDGPLNLVMDIEGEETGLVRAEIDRLASRFPVIVMELHPQLDAAGTFAMMDVLREAGYELADEAAGTVVMKRPAGAGRRRRGRR